MKLIPKNWNLFQHYKDRNPPWIKLHRDLLNNKDFMRLPLASKALAPLLWLLASESLDGTFDADIDELSFRLRLSEKEINDGLKPLIDNGFFLDASTMLAPRLQVAIPETEGETEKEKSVRTPKDIDLLKAIDPQIAKDWLAIRKAKKLPLTKTALDGIEREAKKVNLTLEQALKICCENNWAGFKSHWDEVQQAINKKEDNWYQKLVNEGKIK